MRRPIPPDPVLPSGWTFNEITGPDEVTGKSIGLSLSGGGYRSTLFATGAMVALVDAGLWPQIRWVASVSGGSFANSLAAVTLGDAPKRPEADELIRGVIERTKRGRTLIGLPHRLRGQRPPTLRGRLFQAGIERSWPGPVNGAHLRLADLRTPGRLHAFCAVDKSGLSSVYLTDRFVHAVVTTDDDHASGHTDYGSHIVVPPDDLPLATAVRASACFPGIPAVRVRPSDLGTSTRFPLRYDLLLADGGLWNNLGSNWEETIEVLNRDRVDVPEVIPRMTEIHIVVDSSAQVHRPRTRLMGPGRGALDRRSGLYRAFQATARSGLLAQRASAVRRRPPGSLMHVRVDSRPSDIQLLGAMTVGAAKEDWEAVVGFTKKVGTAMPTLTGVPRDAAVHLLAHGYAQTAADLTAHGIAFDRFDAPHPRIRSAL